MSKKNEIKERKIIDKNDKEKPSIYAGSEEKLLNLVVKIIVKIILNEIA